MNEALTDARLYVGAFMVILAVAVYWVDWRTRVAKFLALFLVIRGGLNVILPFTHERGFQFGVDLPMEIAGHFHIGVTFSGLLFALAFAKGPKWAFWFLGAAWVGCATAYLVDARALWDGPLKFFITAGSLSYFLIGAVLLRAAHVEPDPLAKSGLAAAGVASWAFPAFAGGGDIGFILGRELAGGTIDWGRFLIRTNGRLVVMAAMMFMATAWLQRHPGRSYVLFASALSGLIPWMFAPWKASPVEATMLANAITTLAMPVGMVIAVTRLTLPGYDLAARRASRLVLLLALVATSIALAIIAVQGTPEALLFLAPLLFVAPFWRPWADRCAKAMFPCVASEMSLHRRVQVFQGFFARRGGNPRDPQTLALARSFGIPEWLVARLGPFGLPRNKAR